MPVYRTKKYIYQSQDFFSFFRNKTLPHQHPNYYLGRYFQIHIDYMNILIDVTFLYIDSYEHSCFVLKPVTSG